MNTVLVVEDEPLVMTLMRHILHDYRVMEATTAEEALRLLEDRGPEIQLLISDVTLPRCSGVALALRFRARIRDLPVILMSGYPASGWNFEDSANLYELGSKLVATIQKPASAKVILETVGELIGWADAVKVQTA